MKKLMIVMALLLGSFTAIMAQNADIVKGVWINEAKDAKIEIYKSGNKYSGRITWVKEMYEKGELGKLQFLRASHQQEMAGWPGYWEGLPPMHYATHCVGPVTALAKADAEYVSCFGSGRIDENLISKYLFNAASQKSGTPPETAPAAKE